MGAAASSATAPSPVTAASAAATEAAIPGAKVAEIFIYPIKSCSGISLPSAPLRPTGLRWDREWMVVNEKGRGVTQRVEPKLAFVQVELPNEAFLEDWEPSQDSFMVLKAPGMEPLKVCLNKQHEVANGLSVWEWSGSAWDEGAEASQWFSDYLGKPSQLVRFNTASEVRQVDPDYVKEHHSTFFTDGFPFLLISQESLDSLNEHLEEPIRINRFRPNILVEGCEPFSEDLWSEIKIGRFSFLGSKLCGRCKVTTINQETGIAGREPLETLATFRSGKVIRPNGKNKGAVLSGWFSPFAMRVRIALNLKGLDYEVLEETLNPKSDLLLQSNPVHKKIPVLIHKDKPICESAIIVEYIDEVWNDGPSILPSDAYERANARFWGAYIDDKWFLSMRDMLGAQDDEAKEPLFAQMEEVLGRLEDVFNKCSEGKAFFGGETIGFIDIAFGCYLTWLSVTEEMTGRKVFDEAKFPALVKWAATFAADPAVKGVLPETEKLIGFAKFLQQKMAAAAAAPK